MLYKFSGAGNDFVVLDGRGADVDAYRDPQRIGELCREYRTDGLMILGSTDGYDFSMEFFNPDGTGGMMCGNGGRCIVAFADYLGLKPASPDGVWHFLAGDGPHQAQILQRGGETLAEGTQSLTLLRPLPLRRALTGTAVGPSPYTCPGVDKPSGECLSSPWTVRLKMIDVEGVKPIMSGYFLNTGTRHFVKFVRSVEGVDMEKDGPEYRWDEAFQPEGTNANFVEAAPDGLHVRTFEKGVEAETLACGTGITASAIATCYKDKGADGQHAYRLQCRRGDWLKVDFQKDGEHYTDVFLTGPAELIKIIDL